MIEAPREIKFQELGLQGKVDFIMKDRMPAPEQVVFEPTVEFLDPEGLLTREERAKVAAIGDRTAISYKELAKKVIDDRGKPSNQGELTDKNAGFFQQYALSARSSDEISHTSILEQVGVGPDLYGGDRPIILEGISTLSGLRDVYSQRYASFEALSSRGAIFPENYWRIPQELKEAGIGGELTAINREVYRLYLDLTQKALAHYLPLTEKRPDEKWYEYRWRVLSLALDDSRQVTNGTFLNHACYHPNDALALRETIVQLASSPLPETRGIADKLRRLAIQGLPNLMQYTEASPYAENLPQAKKGLIEKLNIPKMPSRRGMERNSRFIKAVTTSEPEIWFLAAAAASNRDIDFVEVFDHLRTLNGSVRGEIEAAVDAMFEGITLHDRPPKELEMLRIIAIFELSTGAIFEVVRHRPQTAIYGDLSVNGGFTIPQIFKDVDLEQEYVHAIKLNEKGYGLIENLGSKYSAFLPYFVTRAHLQPFVIRMSGVDAFQLSKVRASPGAHPDLRNPILDLDKFLREEKLPFRHLMKK